MGKESLYFFFFLFFTLEDLVAATERVKEVATELELGQDPVPLSICACVCVFVFSLSVDSAVKGQSAREEGVYFAFFWFLENGQRSE